MHITRRLECFVEQLLVTTWLSVDDVVRPIVFNKKPYSKEKHSLTVFNYYNMKVNMDNIMILFLWCPTIDDSCTGRPALCLQAPVKLYKHEKKTKQLFECLNDEIHVFITFEGSKHYNKF